MGLGAGTEQAYEDEELGVGKCAFRSRGGALSWARLTPGHPVVVTCENSLAEDPLPLLETVSASGHYYPAPQRGASDISPQESGHS